MVCVGGGGGGLHGGCTGRVTVKKSPFRQLLANFLSGAVPQKPAACLSVM